MTYRVVRLLPALAKLSAVELEFVLMSYGAHKASRRRTFGVHFAEFAFVAVIIFAEMAGFVIGWIHRHDLWGLLSGSTLALIIALSFCYVAYRGGTLLSIYWWLRSEQGRFILSHAKLYEQFTFNNAASHDP